MAKTNVDLEKTENMDELVEKELATMENTSVENVLHLTKPVMYNGEEVTELAFDFDKLTGADALNIEEELVSRGKTMYYGAINDANYLILMAVKACTKPVGRDFFNKISIVDFERIKNRARFSWPVLHSRDAKAQYPYFGAKRICTYPILAGAAT